MKYVVIGKPGNIIDYNGDIGHSIYIMTILIGVLEIFQITKTCSLKLLNLAGEYTGNKYNSNEINKAINDLRDVINTRINQINVRAY